jgi:uncharacterized glyoxalase superfamily protein PhnB
MAKERDGQKRPIQPIPEGYTSVTPWIISPDAAALIDFLKAAFGAVELARLVGEDGTIGHAEVRIGNAVVMMFDKKKHWKRTPAFLRLYVEDGDATFRRALEAGATAVTEMTHLAWGDRVGRVRDAQGNLYWIQERVEEVDEAEMGRRFGDPKWQAAMDYVTSAELVVPT